MWLLSCGTGLWTREASILLGEQKVSRLHGYLAHGVLDRNIEAAVN